MYSHMKTSDSGKDTHGLPVATIFPLEDCFPTKHDELIHAVRFDFYGNRLATCSSDQKIKVWEFDRKMWKLTADWKAHKGSVWRVEWLHPQFGNVLVSCSFDQSVKIWEECGEEKGSCAAVCVCFFLTRSNC